MSDIIASTYEVLEMIGSGGGGTVYLARHLRLNKKVVLKADKRKLTANLDLLRREVDALKDLSHTYIPQVYDFFAEGDTVYTVMDYIEGESLDKPLKRGEVFSQPQVIKWAKQLLEALCYLHSPTHGDPPRGIVHSDIKPANIMRTPHGDICLIDFNIALALGEKNVVGRSAGYASPEHYGLDFSSDTTMTENNTELIDSGTATVPMSEPSTSKKVIIPDMRSDIYSLGATLYHLLSGVKPAKNALDVLPLSTKDFSPQIVKIITKAMEPNPDMRYQTAEAMLYDFEHLRENDPRVKRRKVMCSVTVPVLVLAIVGGAFSSFTGLKRMEAEQKSLTLAEYAQNELQAGDPHAAISYALEALPEEKGIFVTEYTSAAKKALADASGVYDLSDGFKRSAVVELPSETLKLTLSPSGTRGAALYAFAVAVFDTETGEITETLPAAGSALSDVVFADNDTIIYAGENGVTEYDLAEKRTVWTGKPATQLALSADLSTVAAVYRDESFATVYNRSGDEIATVSFDGNKQKVVENDTFADPEDNLLALSSDGRFLAVSFENGGLMVYDTTDSENTVELYDQSEFYHFEGGFNGQYFAFSSTNDESSVFAVINMAEYVQEGGFALDGRIGVKADESGIYLSYQSTMVKIHPVTGEQTEVAYADADARDFAFDGSNTIVATDKNDYIFYDKDAILLRQYNAGQTECYFVDIAGDYAVVSGRDTPKIQILKQEKHEDSDLFSYDSAYAHDEARISEDKSTVMLFNYKGFRLYGADGALIKDTAIPDADHVYDQQYVKKSGNLAVIYNDAFRLYSGKTGELITEETGLKSVLYTPYGVSIYGPENELRLIDLNTGEALYSGTAEGEYAAYCGMVVDSAFMEGGELIGASEYGGGYVFAVKRGETCFVYDSSGTLLFEAPVLEQTEAFFTDSEMVLSPLHGTPTVFSLETGSKVSDLEKDSYLTYITQLDGYVMSEYISTSGDRYGILLDENSYEPLAYIPSLTDISDNELIFDYHRGQLRSTHIYSIDELINRAKENES